MPTAKVIADMEGDFQVFEFTSRNLAEKFIFLLKEAGYRTQLDPITFRGDEELRDMLAEGIGPKAADAQMELFKLEDQYSNVLDRMQTLQDRISDENHSFGLESGLNRPTGNPVDPHAALDAADGIEPE
jgi:hypothetical protein